MKSMNILGLVFWLFVVLCFSGCAGDADDDDDDDNDTVDDDDDDTVDDDDDDDDDDATTGDDDTSDDDDDSINQESIWYDSTSELHWQNGSDAGQVAMTWNDAIEYCENLYWSGKMNWRVPTISEIRTLVRGCSATETGGSCNVTDECLSRDECWTDDACQCNSLNMDENETYYPEGFDYDYSERWWSYSQVSDQSNYVWFFYAFSASVDPNFVDEFSTGSVRCVY